MLNGHTLTLLAICTVVGLSKLETNHEKTNVVLAISGTLSSMSFFPSDGASSSRVFD